MSRPRSKKDEELERLRAKLEVAEKNRLRAEDESRLKDEFLAQVAHELRTPLNAVLGWIQVLQSKDLTEEEHEHGLEVILQNAQSQGKLIEDLLDLSRIISGRVSLEFGPLSVPDVIEAAINAVMPYASQKRIEIKWAIHPGRAIVLGDPSRLQQALWNLLVNAIKFTDEEGRIHVVLEHDRDFVRVRVVDTGKGIKPEDQLSLFDRLKKPAAREQGGLGIGLFLVKSLVQLHQGNVTVSSDGEGKGSEFVLSLPRLHEFRASATKPRTAADYRTRLDGLRLILVDDDRDSLAALERLLVGCGAEVRSSTLARTALNYIEEFQPSLIVSDISMPDMDGIELITEIRRSKSARELPAIALSAFPQRETRQKSLQAGFQAHIAKPVDLPELVMSISALSR